VLDSSRQQLDRALDGVGIAVWELELPSNTIRWHRSLETLVGPIDGGLPGTLELGLQLVHVDDRARLVESFAGVIAGRVDEFRIDVRLRRADGSDVWVGGRGRPVVVDDRVTSVVGVAVDASARKHAEAALVEREQIFRAVVDNAADGLLVIGDDARYVDLNPAACRILGRSREELIGVSLHDVSNNPVVSHDAWETLMAQGSFRGEAVREAGDGSELIIEYVATANIASGLHLSVVRDVTERRARERRLAQLTDREREVLALMSEGQPTREMAARLYLEPGTVRTHIASLLRKLEAVDRADAVRLTTR
jgi:PAS domain S-box-containing protein